MLFRSDNATEAANFEVAIYDHHEIDNNPENVVGWNQTNAKGTDAGWKRCTGLNIPIMAGTIYWIAMQLDNTDTPTEVDYAMTGGEKLDRTGSISTLADPWGATGDTYGALMAIYAKYEAVSPEAVGNKGCIKKDFSAGDEPPGIYQ